MSSLKPDQLPEYCDRLEKEFEKAKGKKESKIVFKLKNIAEIVDWRDVRPNMSRDFVDSNVLLFTPSDYVPINSQETQLVEELLCCFVGGNTGYIQAEPLSHKNGIRTFRINKELDVKLYDLTAKCLLMASYYSQLCRFIDDNRVLSVGRVNQSLASAMDVTLMEYKSFIFDMERIHRKRNLSLQELWFHIQDVIRILEVMNNIASHIAKRELRGASTLSYMHGQTSFLVEPPSQRDLMKYLTKKASLPYMQSVEEWIFNGIIFDPFEEFMITERPRGSFKDYNSPEYWEKRYQLQKSRVPSFLESVANEILKSGAYLNVIRESAVIINIYKKLKLAPMEEIKYSWKSSKYLDVIHKAYIYSSSYLLSHMMEEYQLMDRFMFMKRYFLVQQGDFVVQVLDTCDEELSKLIVDIIPSRLETLVDMAIKGVEGCVRDDLTIVLQPQDLSYQLSKILTVATAEEYGHKKMGLNVELTGFESFTLGINCRWPISLIFNARIISSYQMLFRLLFYCKYIERLLSRVWLLDQRLRKLPFQQMRQYSTAFALRHKMIYFIQSMQYYMMEEAIEPNWIEFQHQLKRITHSSCVSNMFQEASSDSGSSKVHSIDDLFDIHKKFLDKCMSDCLLTNGTLFPIFQELLTVCKDFVKFIIVNEHEKNSEIIVSNFDTFSTTISMMDEKFQEQYVLLLKKIAELAPSDDGATKIFEILHRANFNFYFTSMMEDTI